MQVRAKLIKTNEAAERLGVSVFTIRRLATRGVLPAVRLGDRSHLRFVEADVDQFVERRGKVAA